MMDVDGEHEPEHVPAGPKPIVKLTEDVINKIAAAEIIHRPSNAIKELLENSLDAGSTSIKLLIKEGGLKLIQITDNGHGIRRDDLPLLCTRYATSKLRKFDDLQALTTYGFRGEALASISYCSHVEVVTKTKEDGCGWKAHYSDGELAPAKPGMAANPKPTAANDGTVISAEDLFFSMPSRRRAFKSPSEEYNRILDVVTKYAIHNPHVAWVCKKAGTSLPDISTSPATARTNIGLLYSPALANDLLEVPETILQPADKLGARCRGWVSNANANWARRGGWLLFINRADTADRLVDSSKIKKAIDQLYTAFLPKGASPWAYLSLDIDPAKVDVNVHPTKSEVHFLNEDEMIEAVIGAVHSVLANANTSRTFSVQTLLPGAADPASSSEKRPDASASRKPAPNYKVRVDPGNRTLDAMISVTNPSQLIDYTETQVDDDDAARPRKRRAVAASGSNEEPFELDEEEKDDSLDDDPSLGSLSAGRRGNDIPESVCEFTSIAELRKATKKAGNHDMTELMQKHAFVGIVDRGMTLSLIQYSTKLFLVNHAKLADIHFYQLGLRQFGAFSRLKLDPPPSVREMLELAAEDDEGIPAAGLTVESVVNDVFGLLMEKRDMLDEYFSVSISEDGLLETIPMLLKGYTPDLDQLPHLLLCLGAKVDWTSEKECFDTFLKELAFSYSPRYFLDSSPTAQGNKLDHSQIEADESSPGKEELAHQAWQLEHVLFPSFRKHTAWPRDLVTSGIIKQVANLPDLFRIFERC